MRKSEALPGNSGPEPRMARGHLQSSDSPSIWSRSPRFLLSWSRGPCCDLFRVGGEWAGVTASSGFGPPPPPPLHKLPCGTVSASVCHRVLELEPRPAEMPSLGLVMENGQALPAFLLCSTLLVIKMYAVGVITGYTRLRKKVRDLGCV